MRLYQSSATTTTTSKAISDTISPSSPTTMTNPSKNIVRFGGSAKPVPNPDKNILGGKGLGLQEMSSVGIDVPPGFTLTTPLCKAYQVTGDLSDEVWEQTKLAIADVEKDMGRKFGDATNPLLLSCRSGAALSMPGMMDTVLNVVRCFLVTALNSWDVG